MNSILRKSLGLVLVLFIMVLGLSTVVIVKATEAAFMSEDFESDSAHRTSGSNNYNSNSYTSNSITWTLTYADSVTSGSPLTGSANIMGRVAKNTTNSPVVETSGITIPSSKRVTKLSYNIKGVGAMTVVVQYKIDSGNWVTLATISNCPTSKTNKEHSFNGNVTGSTISLKFTISVSSSTGSNRDVQLDDIILYSDDIPTDPEILLSSAGNQTKVYLDSTLAFSTEVLNIDEPYEINWSSTEESVATIDSSGVLHPVGIGKTTIKATINTTESNGIEVTVLPNPANPITIAQANAIADVVGEGYTTELFTIVGTFTYTDATHFTVTNGDSIVAYKNSGHGYTDAINGARVAVTGKITKYDNTTPEVNNPTVSRLYTVTIDKDNGDTPVVLEDVYENTTIDQPANPTRDGYTFTGWKCGANDWNFATDVVTGNINIVAQWQQQQANAYDDFKLLTPRASLKLDYSSQVVSQLFSSNFIRTAKNDNTLPAEWEGTVGGSYDNPYYQSFKTNNDYIVLKDAYNFPYSFSVTFTYYLNNYNSGNNSSKIKFVGLDENGDEVCSVLSDEMNFSPTGSSNVRTVSVKINGEDIKKIKIVFVKNGGGNIAFSTVTVNSLSFALNKEENKNLVSMRFATLLDATLAQRLADSGTTVTYGMVYGYASSFGALSADEICEMISVGGSSEGDTSALVAQGIKFRAMTLTGVNSSGTEEVVNDPDYYQFGISINKFSDARLDDDIKAFAYVCIDGNYYATNARVFSIYSLAEQYVIAADTSSYTEHLGVLAMLAGNLN